MAPNEPCLWYFHHCIIFSPWVWTGPRDFLLKNRMQQKLWAVTCELAYKNCGIVSQAQLVYLPWWKEPPGKELKVASGQLSVGNSTPQSNILQGTESNQRLMSELGNWSFPCQALRSTTDPSKTLTAALWGIIKQKTQLSLDSCPEKLWDNKCIWLLSFRVICYTAVDN